MYSYRALVEKKICQFGILGIICNKQIIHLFRPNQGNIAFIAKMLFWAVLPALCQAAHAEQDETFNMLKLKQAIKHSNTGLQLIKQE